MKIKVLETIRQGQIGGGESHLLSLVENLNKEIYEPIVLSFTDGPMVEKLKNMGIKAEVIYTETPFDVRVWGKVLTFIKENNIQLVHAHGTRANSNVFWATKKLNLPLVYTVHGWSFHDDQNFLVKNFRLYGEKLLTHKSDVNICVAESNKATGLQYLPHLKARVINNGINLKKFNPNNSFSNVREELGVKEDEILILFLARFTHQKQPLKLIHAFEKAWSQNNNIKLLLVGDGEQKDEALELVNTLQCKNHIIFQTYRQDVPDVLAAADVFVLPSLWEGLPIGLLEAMAMKKAIIASKVDGTKEVIENQVNGLLFELENSSHQLPELIMQLSNNSELRNQLGSKAFETISTHYSADNMTREVEKIYHELLNK